MRKARLFDGLRSAVFLLVVLSANGILAQPPRQNAPIVLTADDTAMFAAPPADFEDLRKDIPHGKLDTLYYPSKTVGTIRRIVVYTPPGYSVSPGQTEKYPVLYLLHGIGGDDKEWLKYSSPHLILDNLIADKKTVPMIVIFPNGRAMPNDKPEGNIYDAEKVKAFANFEFDLLNDLIPFVEDHYRVVKGSSGRAIAGFSMGGGQSLDVGLGHPDIFAWIGGFSSAPNTKKPQELVPDPAVIREKVKLLYISCGNEDGLIAISRGLHLWLRENKVPHIYQIQPGKHNIEPWKKDLYHFSQLIFR